MSTPPSYVPRTFCQDPRQFGVDIPDPLWHLPSGAGLAQLRASIVQHHAAARLRTVLRKKDTPQAVFARAVDESPQRLSNVVCGAVVMQIRDLGNAATLGGNALPVVDVLVDDVHRYGVAQPRTRPRQSPGDYAGFDSGRDVDYAITVPQVRERTLAEVTTHERALAAFRPVLVEALQRAWPQLCAAVPMILDLDTAGAHVVGARVHHGEEGVVVWACVDNDWDSAVRDRGYATIDGVLILRVAETDDAGRPVRATGLAAVTDMGEPILISQDLTVTWDGDQPQLLWDPFTNPDIRPGG